MPSVPQHEKHQSSLSKHEGTREPKLDPQLSFSEQLESFKVCLMKR